MSAPHGAIVRDATTIGWSISAAKAYRKLGAQSAAATVLAHRDAHPWCGTRIDFGPILEHIKAARSA